MISISDLCGSIKAIVITCCSALLGFCVWIYTKTITDPLRIFYFTGPWYWNVPTSEVCFQMTRIEANYWDSCPAAREQCQALMERNFQSFYATVWTTFYFTILTFIVLQITCNIFFIKPIIKSLKR